MRTTSFAVGPFLLIAACVLTPSHQDAADAVVDTATEPEDPEECPAHPPGIGVYPCVVSTAPDWFEERNGEYDVFVSGVVTAVGADVQAPEGSTAHWGDDCDHVDVAVQVVDAAGSVWTLGWTTGGQPGLAAPDVAIGASLDVRAVYQPGSFSPPGEALALYQDGQVLFAYEAERVLTAEERGGVEVRFDAGCVFQSQHSLTEYLYVTFTGVDTDVSLQQGEHALLQTSDAALEVTVSSAYWWVDCADACGEHRWVLRRAPLR